MIVRLLQNDLQEDKEPYIVFCLLYIGERATEYLLLLLMSYLKDETSHHSPGNANIWITPPCNTEPCLHLSGTVVLDPSHSNSLISLRSAASLHTQWLVIPFMTILYLELFVPVQNGFKKLSGTIRGTLCMPSECLMSVGMAAQHEIPGRELDLI